MTAKKDAVRMSGTRTLVTGTPDGICADEENAVWYADVPNRCCVRVAEGGKALQTVELDRGGFACALGGVGGRTLFVVVGGQPAIAAMSSSRLCARVLRYTDFKWSLMV
ncbi:SMP-30/gluconolactonase/LRE family protein [Nonomuraea angiospora]